MHPAIFLIVNWLVFLRRNLNFLQILVLYMGQEEEEEILQIWQKNYNGKENWLLKGNVDLKRN